MKLHLPALILGRMHRLGFKAKRRLRYRQTKGDKIKFPWEKDDKQLHRERLERHQVDRENPTKKLRRFRVKFPQPPKPTTVGPGYPGFAMVYANVALARGDRERKVLQKSPSGNPLVFEPLRTTLPRPVPDNVFEEYCRRIGIEPFNIENAAEESHNAIDVKAFDLYYEDIRIDRNSIVKEMKHLPLVEPVEIVHLASLEKSIFDVSRSCYYSPITSHSKSEDVMHLLIWFLNRRNLPVAFQIKLLQALSLFVYLSPVFKNAFVECGGLKVVYRSLQIGMIVCPIQACWACYVLTMAAIGSSEIIVKLQKTIDFDETIGEMVFPMYWHYWPANFANILQSIVYGPGGVANSDETFEFL